MRFTICLLAFMLSVLGQAKNGFDLESSLIEHDEIHYGGPAKDGIASIDQPHFITAKQANLSLEQTVVGVYFNGVAKAYPINILNWHEVVNDQFGGHPLLVSYCPLCGTAMVFDALIDQQTLNFGVSGLLYQSDVLLYDRLTQSLWSQLLSKSVSGELAGKELTLLPSRHTSYQAWLRQHPDTLVLSEKTGYKRDYQRDPYQGYAESRRLYFDVNHRSEVDLHVKQWVLGVTINGQAKAYPLNRLRLNKLAQFEDSVGGEMISVHYDAIANNAFIRDSKGKELASTKSYWFAWFTFNPQTQLYSY